MVGRTPDGRSHAYAPKLGRSKANLLDAIEIGSLGLEVDIDGVGEGTVAVRVAGELDLSTAERLWRVLEEVESRPGLRELLLDYSRLDFVDSTGLQLLLDADVRARLAGWRLSVIAGGGEARRLLELADVIDELTVTDRR